jgi:hypothetical protein
VKARSALIDAQFLGLFFRKHFRLRVSGELRAYQLARSMFPGFLIFKILLRKHNGFTNVCNCFEILRTSVGEIAICSRLLMVSLVFARAVLFHSRRLDLIENV